MATSTFTESLSLLDDAALRRMADRAYWTAARAWGEAVATRRNPALRAMLKRSAESDSAYYDALKAEIARRESVGTACHVCGGDHPAGQPDAYCAEIIGGAS